MPDGAYAWRKILTRTCSLQVFILLGVDLIVYYPPRRPTMLVAAWVQRSAPFVYVCICLSANQATFIKLGTEVDLLGHASLFLGPKSQRSRSQGQMCKKIIVGLQRLY